MERWLKHPKYLPLAEAPEGADTPWGFRWDGPFSLCPTDPGSLALLADLYSQLLPNFTSGLFNVGCDETFDIGQGKSKDECRRRGVHQVYLDYLCRVNDLASRHGRRMMFWGDIILKEPELIRQLPPNVIALNWGYEADHPFDAEASRFSQSGVPFYVCPGTSSWCSIAGRTDNMLANQRRRRGRPKTRRHRQSQYRLGRLRPSAISPDELRRPGRRSGDELVSANPTAICRWLAFWMRMYSKTPPV